MEEDKKWVNSYFKRLTDAYNSIPAKVNLLKLKELMLEVKKNDGKIVLVGNGASNTIATHGAIDFTNQLGIQSMSINDGGFLTAAANDFGYEDVFERAVNLYLRKGDLFIGVSSSGASPNVRNGAKRAKEIGANVVTFSGFDEENPLRQLGEINFYVESDEYNIVESIHNAWLVCVVDMIIKDNIDSVGVHGLEFGIEGKVYKD